jgi:hypothetical protein
MRWTRRFTWHRMRGRSHSDACCRVWENEKFDDGQYMQLPPQEMLQANDVHDDAVGGGGLAEGNLAGRRMRVSAAVLSSDLLLAFPWTDLTVCVCVCVHSIRFDSPLLAPPICC